MSVNPFKITEINGRKIVIGGIGKFFYQEGLPIGITVNHLKSKGYEVSIYHLFDELSKEGWTEDRIYNKIREELADTGLTEELAALKAFSHASYETQRAMIFDYLFKDVVTATEWFRKNV